MTVPLNADSLRVLWYMFFPGGGIGRYTHEVAQELDRLPDVDFELACLKEYQFLAGAQYDTWPKLWRIHSELSGVRRFRFLCGQVISPRRAIRHAARANVDVLHLSNINHLTYPLWRGWLRRHPSMRVAATAHDIRRSKKIIHRGWEDGALRQFYEEADALFIHSPQQKADLLDFARVSEDRIHQVPMGIIPYAAPTASRDELRKRMGIPAARRVGLFFGNVRDDKNLDGLLEAMTMVSDPIFLIIAGRAGGSDNRGMNHYRQKAQMLGLSRDVLFLDRFIEDREVGDLFEVSDFVPLCYLSSFTSQSAVLNVAMYYRKPILVSPAPTLAESSRTYDIGVVTESDSPDSIAAGMECLLERIETGSAFGFDFYRQKNSWKENARITRDVYHRITGR